ncbi:MAG TPA: cytochrome P450 [Solirubrobacteraceae bacterium]|nr:cytochrome P450 [Solirubrobacteraceae bacterium]
MTRARVAAGTLALASLPYWLPEAVVALRMRIFTHAGGNEGIAIPGRTIDATHLEEVYAHPAANGRSRGAALSDLFWYWLSPAPELHQEHLEPGPRYDEVALTTRRLLARPRATVAALAADCATRVLDERPVAGPRLVRLRDLAMPIWAEFAYELVFGARCPRRARELIVGNANDVVTSLKCTGLRHMGRRHRLTRYLVDTLEHGTEPLQPLPAGLSTRERAVYLQGAFFNTAVVQMSEATAHLLMVIAQQPGAQERLTAEPDDGAYFDRVLDETLRLYPLFGIAHRITSAEIAVDGHTIPPGSVLCFNYPAYHRTGYDEPEAFRPERWESLSHRDAAFIPFGVAGNRPCPARGIAPVALQAATREVVRRFALASSASHTRSIPNRGPCVLVSRTAGPEPRLRLSLLLAFVRVRDRWEDVWRSLVQLVLGTYMVWDARRLRLCERHFEAAEPAITRAPRRARRPCPP